MIRSVRGPFEWLQTAPTLIVARASAAQSSFRMVLRPGQAWSASTRPGAEGDHLLARIGLSTHQAHTHAHTEASGEIAPV